jgi:ribosomal protein L44E
MKEGSKYATRRTLQRFCKDCGRLTPCNSERFNQTVFYCTKCWDQSKQQVEESYQGKEADLAAALQTALS